MARPLLFVAALAPLLLAPGPSGPARAEMLGPGTYRGWVVEDRWGTTHLANGVYLLPLERPAAEKARRFTGMPVSVDVAEIGSSTPLEHSIARIGSIERTDPAHRSLEVDLVPGETRLAGGESQRLEVRVRYAGEGPLEFRLEDLAVLVRRRGPPLPESAWSQPARDDRGTPWSSGGWSMLVLELHRRHENRAVYRAPGGRVVANGPFRYGTELVATFPPGEYEAWAILGDRNFSKAPDGRSALVPFDVVAKPR
jgi:hypothetical protein